MKSTPAAQRGHGPEKKDLSARMIPPLARIFVRLLNATLRVRVYGARWIDAVEDEGGSAVLPFFHGRQFLLAANLIRRKIPIMSSLSRDGEHQARILGGLGYRIVRGSASRGGARGLIGMKKAMEEGYHATFAVDGPKGPLHEVKPGVIYLAKKTGAPVIPILASARPAFVMKRTWDLYLLPMPFARGVILFGEPIFFDARMDDDAMDRDCRVLRDRMLELQEEADRMVGRKKTKE